MFWFFLVRGTRSPDASKIPVDEIVEEWRSRSSRGRYEHAMWTAAGLEEPRSRWEKQEGREPTWAAEEHGARAFEGDEAMDNLRARTRSGSERTRSSALPSHHILICLQPSYGILVLR